MFDLQYDGELPKIYLTEREATFFGSRFTTDRPLMVLQTNGGGDTNLKYSWARDIPYKNVVDAIETFKGVYNIVHIKREDQIGFENTIPVTESFRGLVV